ncbi:MULTISPECIES: BLUF domain-containing protein [Stenotrophomonas]|jgi:hypothetical protein|uniref:BLUF domain-containing protein n=1 Tax=Stenotrophomonas TaxID=40323 RepID=UPI00081CAE4D|nr:MULTISPECIES: BLUF domain-containing protein [Stenotrophomonas]AOA72441.1 hypothetical protein BAY15_2007 [Stenotrophomonas rhizophila]
MPLHAIAYWSQVVPDLTLDKVDHLARDAMVHNLIMDVTGVLLTDGNRFLQYLEGPETAVKQNYRRITNARSHTRMVELGRSTGRQRRFPSWPLRWLLVEPEDIRLAIVSDWRGLAHRKEVDVFQVRAGIERLTQLIDPFLGIEIPDFGDPV